MPLEKVSAPRKSGVVSVLPATPSLKKSVPTARPVPAVVPPPLPAYRKVLVVEGELSIRNALYILLGALGFEGDSARRIHQALSMLSHDGFDAILLDLRCSEMVAPQAVDKIGEIRPSLLGRVLVITGEVADRQTLESFERCVLLPTSLHSLRMEDIRNRLQLILGLRHG